VLLYNVNAIDMTLFLMFFYKYSISKLTDVIFRIKNANIYNFHLRLKSGRCASIQVKIFDFGFACLLN